MKSIHVDMSTRTVRVKDLPQPYRGIGGRALTSTYINDHVPADCDPLGKDNILIFAPGYFSGTPLINTSRLSVGAKSPLTGGIKESNVGGTVAAAMANLGVSAVIVSGQAGADGCWILKLDADGSVGLLEANDCKGMRTYALVDKLKTEHGKDNSITCIGPAGELQLSAASIQTTDLDGRPCRAAGRGGLGAVMGAKGLKAIVVSRAGKSADPLADAEAFKAAAKAYARAVKTDEFSGEILPALGSACLVAPINEAGALPTRNAREGRFEGAERISGEAMAAIIKQRGGKPQHKGCAQCIIDCSNEYVDRQGRYVTSSLEYETIWSMGAMIGNDDLDAIARLDFLCDDIGLDTISTGVAVAVAMDAGYKPFGDAAAAIAMVEAVATGSVLGRLIGNGPAAVGRHFNHSRVPVMKGQSMAAYDPRAIQGMAVTYATSPMGGDHTAGWVVDQNLESFGGTLDRFSAKGQVEASRNTQIHMAAVDSVGICDFAQTGLASPEGIATVYRMVAAKSGHPFDEVAWQALGLRVLKAERDFNHRAGFTPADDHLPSMFYEEPLPPHNTVVVIGDQDMERAFDF